MIEFSNRLITVPVCIAAGLAWLGALRRRPYRRDLMWLGALLPLGVLAQAVLGGLTVRGELDYGWVMAHFALSMLILIAAVVLVWRARQEPLEDAAAEDRRQARLGGILGGAARRWRALLVPLRPADGQGSTATDPTIVKGARGLVALGALTIFAGHGCHRGGPARGRRTRPEDQSAELRRARHDGLRHSPSRGDRVRVQHRRGGPVVAGAPAPCRRRRCSAR